MTHSPLAGLIGKWFEASSNEQFLGAKTIKGAWEASDDGSEWRVDFDMVYRRRDR